MVLTAPLGQLVPPCQSCLKHPIGLLYWCSTRHLSLVTHHHHRHLITTATSAQPPPHHHRHLSTTFQYFQKYFCLILLHHCMTTWAGSHLNVLLSFPFSHARHVEKSLRSVMLSWCTSQRQNVMSVTRPMSGVGQESITKLLLPLQWMMMVTIFMMMVTLTTIQA